jgi:hypothetical protein
LILVIRSSFSDSFMDIDLICSSFYLIRLLKFRLLRLESTVMLSVTLLRLISSLLRSLKILFLLPTIVMYASISICLCFSFQFLYFYSLFNFNFIAIFSSFQVPHVNRTDYQLIDISEDGFVSLTFS